jgi:DNA-binding XRE family transcriptional regulator
MTLELFEDALEPIRKAQEKTEFSTTIRNARNAVGIKQYRAAEFMGVKKERLKNLETEFFCDMPPMVELYALSALYGLDLVLLEKKAGEFVDGKAKRRQR